MVITRAQIEARLAEAKNQHMQLQGQLVGTAGVIADLEYWLQVDSQPEPPPSKEVNSTPKQDV